VPDRRLRWLVPAALVASAVLALVVALVVGGGEYQPSVPGLPDAGGLVGWGLPLVRLLAVGAAVMTVGWLLAAAVLDPQGRKGAVEGGSRRRRARSCCCTRLVREQRRAHGLRSPTCSACR
jgi:putative copper resistance protein D